MVYPAALVVGLATRTEGTKYQVATGKYNEMIDDKIAEIKRDCPDTVADIHYADSGSSSSPEP
jgi:hypothetical protein